MSQQPEQNKTAEFSIEDILQWMNEDVDNAFARLLPPDEYGENEDAHLLWDIIKNAQIHLQQTASLQKQVELLQIRDEKREARESNLHKENGGLHAQIESIQKQVEEYQNALADWGKAYNNKHNDWLSSRKGVTSLQKQVEELREKLETAKWVAREQVKTVNQLKADIETLSHENTSLTCGYEELREEIKSREAVSQIDKKRIAQLEEALKYPPSLDFDLSALKSNSVKVVTRKRLIRLLESIKALNPQDNQKEK